MIIKTSIGWGVAASSDFHDAANSICVAVT